MYLLSIILEQPIKIEIINNEALCNFILNLISTISGVIIGGFLTYIFTLKTQRKEFLNHIMNDARLKINDSLFNYQDWLGEVRAFIITNEYRLSLGIFDMDCKFNYEPFINLSYDVEKFINWGVIMEEYEILFPETKNVRKSLLLRNREIKRFLDEFECKIEGLEKEDFIKYRNDINEIVVFIEDQINLIEDLKIHLQNKVLSKITKNKATERVTDPSRPRIINRNGELLISTDS